MNLKKKLKRIFSITYALFFVLIGCFALPSDVHAAEYNDVYLYTTTGTLVRHTAYTTNTYPLSSFVLEIMTYPNVSVENSQWTVTGTYTALPCPANMVLDYTAVSSAYYTVGSDPTHRSFTDSDGHWLTGSISTTNYPDVKVYLPYTSQGSSGIPQTPTLMLSGSSLTWTPQGYTAKILYSEDGTIYEPLNTSASQPFTVSDTGYYRVQLNYYYNGENRLTDASNRVQYIANDGDASDLARLWYLIQNIFTGIQNALSTITSYIWTLSDFVRSVFSWLPGELPDIFLSVAVVGLILGLFLK